MAAVESTIRDFPTNSFVEDNELIVDVQCALRSSAYASGLRHVNVRYREGSVALSGRVATYYLKQMAQHLAMLELERSSLVNEIRVDGLSIAKSRR